MPADPKYTLNSNDLIDPLFWSNFNLETVVDAVNNYEGTKKLDLDKTKEGTTNKIFSATEKSKLAGIQAGAQVNTVNSVAGKTGAVVLTKADVGLGNVDNTSDLNKPISTATQAALDLKVQNVPGKQLSTEDYTTAEKNKLAGIEAGAKNQASNDLRYIKIADLTNIDGGLLTL